MEYNSYNDYKLKNCKEPISAYFINHKCMLLLFGGQKTTRIYICKLQISLSFGKKEMKKNLRHCRNRFSKMIFQTSWNEESRHNNEHLILQKLTLDPFKQGFILVFQFENFQVQIVSQIVIGFKLWFVKKPKCVWKQPVWLQFWMVPKWNLVKKLAMTAF